MSKILGIDIGGTNTKIASVDDSGKTGPVISLPTSAQSGLDDYLEAITRAAREILTQESSITGVGIGVAGFIDAHHTTMTFNPNISWLEGINLCTHFSSTLNLPVTLEVDSNAAALAEYVYGNDKECKRLLVLTVGTGLGGGMIVEGEVLRIANECLGDIGHVIVEPGGFQCNSGCHGCAEAMACAPALERYYAQSNSPKGTLPEPGQSVFSDKIRTLEIIAAAQQGDQAAKTAIQKIGGYLGIALASIAPILSPDCICLAGGVSEAGLELLEATESSFKKFAGLPYWKDVKVHKAKLGWQSVLIGATVAHQRT